MKTIPFLHKLQLLVMLCTAAFMLVSCSGKDEIIDDPDGQATGQSDWKDVPASGGTITKGDIALTFPPGTFLTNSKVAVTELAKGEVGGEHEVSKFYEITLPATTKAPVKITIKSKEQADDIYFVERGLGYSPSYDRYIVSAYSTEGTYDNGMYTMTLPAMENGKENVNFAIGLAHVQRIEGDDAGSRADDEQVGEVKWHVDVNYGPKMEWLGLIPYPDFRNFGLLWMSSTEQARFHKKYPILKRAIGEALGKIQELGYKVKTDRDIPIIVTGCVEEYGMFTQSRIADEKSTLTIGLEKMVADDDTIAMKQTVIHELMHYFQSDYDTRSPWDKAGENGDEAILYESGAVWAEKFMDKGNLNVNFILQFLPQFLSAGLVDVSSAYEGDAESATNHKMYQHQGYGMAPLLEYMTKKMGLTSTVELFELWHKASDKTTFSALKAWAKKHGSDMFDGNNFDDFFKSLVNGEVIPGTIPSMFTNGAGSNFNSEGKSQELVERCTAYGCKLQQITVNNTIADLNKKELVVKQRNKDVQTYIFYYTNPKDIHWVDGIISAGDSAVIDLAFMEGETRKLNVFTLTTNKGNKSMHMSAITQELRKKDQNGLGIQSVYFDASFTVKNYKDEQRDVAAECLFTENFTVTTSTSSTLTLSARRITGDIIYDILVNVTGLDTSSPVAKVSFSRNLSTQQFDVEMYNMPCTLNSADEKVWFASKSEGTLKVSRISYRGSDNATFNRLAEDSDEGWAEITIKFNK